MGRQRPHSRLSVGTRRLAPLFVPVFGGAAAVVVVAVWHEVHSPPSLRALAGIFTLLVLATLAEAYPVPIEGVSAGRTSLASVLIVAVAVVYGWAPAALVGGAAMLIVELARRRSPSHVLYNTANYVLSAAAAGVVAGAIGTSSLGRLSVATLVAWAAFYAVNISLLVAVTVVARRRPILEVLSGHVSSTAAPAMILASFAVVVVTLWDLSPFLIIALLCPLAVIAHHERWLHASLYRLRELDRMKNEFMAIVSHELRTPLASVYGAAMTLQRPALSDDVRESMLAIVYRESARLAHLVDQVLWASRLEAGSTGGPPARFDAARLVREVVESARARPVEGISFELHEADGVPPVVADPEKVRHVLVNLVENAVKYSPDGGRIDVAVGAAGPAVRFSVHDHGIGIPSEEQERIFEKFHRLDPHLRRGVGGTGLGLYICRQLIQQMDGHIWVASREGEGSTFTFELPAADGANGSERQDDVLPLPAAANGGAGNERARDGKAQ